MRKTILIIAIAGIFAACNNEKKEPATATETQPKPAVALPYNPTYSTSFEMGNPAYTAMVVQGSWKDWEENKLDNMKNWVADTVKAFLSDNSAVMGRDSLMARWKRGRAGYSSVIDTLNAAMAVYSTDKKEDWVLIWATEINTNTAGKADTAQVMETWRINKDGKADMLFQHDRARRKQ